MNILSFPYIDTATPTDFDEGKRMQAEFDHLEGHINSVRHVPLLEKWKAARAQYLASPTDKNFELVKLVSFERRFFHVQTEAKQVAHGARAHFVETQIVPWATALVTRALDKARANLERVTEEESARHRELTGEPMSVSGIVEAAKRPVRHLESFLKDMPGNPRSVRVAAILKLFGESGPLLGSVSPEDVARATRSVDRLSDRYATDGSGLKLIHRSAPDPDFVKGLAGEEEDEDNGDDTFEKTKAEISC